MPQATDTDTVAVAVAVAGLGNCVITDSDTCSACRGEGSWVIVGAIAYRISDIERTSRHACHMRHCARICVCVRLLVCACVCVCIFTWLINDIT